MIEMTNFNFLLSTSSSTWYELSYDDIAWIVVSDTCQHFTDAIEDWTLYNEYAFVVYNNNTWEFVDVFFDTIQCDWYIELDQNIYNYWWYIIIWLLVQPNDFYHE